MTVELLGQMVGHTVPWVEGRAKWSGTGAGAVLSGEGPSSQGRWMWSTFCWRSRMARAAVGVPMHRRGRLGEEALYWHSSWHFQIPGISSKGTFALERRVMSELVRPSGIAVCPPAPRDCPCCAVLPGCPAPGSPSHWPRCPGFYPPACVSHSWGLLCLVYQECKRPHFLEEAEIRGSLPRVDSAFPRTLCLPLPPAH